MDKKNEKNAEIVDPALWLKSFNSNVQALVPRRRVGIPAYLPVAYVLPY